MTSNTLHNRILGSLVGGAAGDALGYPVEFIYSHADICRRYGPEGITDYDLHFIPGTTTAQVSDDTQMTLFTAEGLLYAVDNTAPILPAICQAYLHWYGGQTGHTFKGGYPSQLAAIDELNQNRAPGNTCLSALRAILSGHDPVNSSKGCGGIMRIAPIALYGASHDWPLDRTGRLAGDAAEITHLHPLSTLSSACCAAIIQLCVLRPSAMTREAFADIVGQALQCVRTVYPDSKSLDEFCDIVRNALAIAAGDLPDSQAIEQHLGGGWVAEETLAIALFSVVRHIDSFSDCLRCAVNHGGDSDSTGAVAGNILGAILGYDTIPDNLTTPLQLLPLLRDVAEGLA